MVGCFAQRILLLILAWVLGFHFDQAIAEAVWVTLVNDAALAHEDGLVAIIEFVEAVRDPECCDAA